MTIPVLALKDLRYAVMNSTADIFHVDGDPDWIVREIKEFAGGRPVIYDMHDLWSGIHNRISIDELDTLHMSDGIVFVSEAQRQDTLKRFRPLVPTRVIQCRCNYWQYISPDDRFSHMGQMVYVGGLGNPEKPDVSFSIFRDYTKIFKKFRDMGVLIHIYGVGGKDSLIYHDFGVLHPTIGRYTDLIDRLSAYDWGFVGFQDNAPPMVQQALPNKLWEYIAACVVPVIYNCKESADFVTKEEIGIVLDRVEDFPKLATKETHAKCLKNLLAKRDEWTMEKQMPQLASLYDEVLNPDANKATYSDPVHTG